MRILQFERADIFVSPDLFHDIRMRLEEGEEDFGESDTVEYFTDCESVLHNGIDSCTREYIQLFVSTSQKPKSFAFLNAHGFCEKRSWMYSDGRRANKVQSWIDRYDDKYAVLVLLVCNTDHLTPRSKKSLLVVPDRSFRPHHLGLGEASLSLIYPEKGELDYTIEHEIVELKRLARRSV